MKARREGAWPGFPDTCWLVDHAGCLLRVLVGVGCAGWAQGHRVLSLVLPSAVKSGRLTRNISEDVALSRVRSEERLHLSPTSRSPGGQRRALRCRSTSTPRPPRPTARRTDPSSCSSPTPDCDGVSSPGSVSESSPPCGNVLLDPTAENLDDKTATGTPEHSPGPTRWSASRRCAFSPTVAR